MTARRIKDLSPPKRTEFRHVITRDEAFKMYRSMGPGRSITKLHELLSTRAAKEGFEMVRIDTMRQWSYRHKWIANLKEHEAQVEAGMQRKLLEAEINARMPAKLEFRDASLKMLDKIRERIKFMGIEHWAEMSIAVDLSNKLMERSQLLPSGDEPRKGMSTYDKEDEAAADSVLAELENLTKRTKAT